MKNNITKKERNALKNIQHDELRSYRVQEVKGVKVCKECKGSHFVVLGNQNYIEKINYQVERGSIMIHQKTFGKE